MPVKRLGKSRHGVPYTAAENLKKKAATRAYRGINLYHDVIT
jgi:hypothetical protein